MKVLIEIHCETQRELITHLKVITSALKRKTPEYFEEGDSEFSDMNCYGEHDVYVFMNDKIQLAIDESEVNKIDLGTN